MKDNVNMFDWLGVYSLNCNFVMHLMLARMLLSSGSYEHLTYSTSEMYVYLGVEKHGKKTIKSTDAS